MSHHLKNILVCVGVFGLLVTAVSLSTYLLYYLPKSQEEQLAFEKMKYEQGIKEQENINAIEAQAEKDRLESVNQNNEVEKAKLEQISANKVEKKQQLNDCLGKVHTRGLIESDYITKAGAICENDLPPGPDLLDCLNKIIEQAKIDNISLKNDENICYERSK